MAVKIDPKDLAAIWTIEAEKAGFPALVGTTIRIEIQQVNPMIRRAVITPTNGRVSDESFGGVFVKIKPCVSMIQDDMLLCSLGIMARRNK